MMRCAGGGGSDVLSGASSNLIPQAGNATIFVSRLGGKRVHQDQYAWRARGFESALRARRAGSGTR